MKIRYLAALAALIVFGGMLAYGADEITASTLLKIKNGNLDLTRNVNALQIDQAGDSMDYHIQSIGTNSEPVTVIADVASNGVCFFRNLDTTAGRFVDIVITMRLKAGEAALLRVHPTNTISATASSGSVNLETWINED